MYDAYAQAIDGFRYTNVRDEEHNGEVVKIVSRVQDQRVLDDRGPTFFVRFENGEVGVVTATLLSPWFQV
jgi:hypothetical protein